MVKLSCSYYSNIRLSWSWIGREKRYQIN